MNAGAVDFVAKPAVSNRQQLEDFIKNELLVKIKIASTARISNIKKTVLMQQEQQQSLSVKRNNLIVAIGASTGGTEAIFSVVKDYGTDIPGIVCVQHMPPKFTEMYAKRVNGHCPSVEVLFESVAKAAGADAVGIILTGMGGDGGKGLLSMRKAGARTIGQDESTCVVYGMPKVAYDLGAVEFQEKLGDIAGRTYALLNKM